MQEITSSGCGAPVAVLLPALFGGLLDDSAAACFADSERRATYADEATKDARLQLYRTVGFTAPWANTFGQNAWLLKLEESKQLLLDTSFVNTNLWQPNQRDATPTRVTPRMEVEWILEIG